jgi:hypothetical protein
MSAAELKELKQMIIHEVQFVEEEWKLKAFAKLLDLENLDSNMGISLSESEWLEIEADEKDYQNGLGDNFSLEEVKNIVLSKIK